MQQTQVLGFVGGCLGNSHDNTPFLTYAVTDTGRRAAQSIKKTPRRRGRVVALPVGCKAVPRVGGGVGDPLIMCIYVDDSILVEVQFLLMPGDVRARRDPEQLFSFAGRA